MAIITIPAEGTVLTDESELAKHLAGIGIQYGRWEAAHAVAPDAPAEEILAAYGAEIERLKALGGYVVADLIDVTSTTPGLDLMLEKFKRAHWHDEDEVRFIIEGRGVFHIQPQDGPVTAIEVARRPDLRAEGDAPLVQSLCRPPHQGHTPFPRPFGLDAALHRERR